MIEIVTVETYYVSKHLKKQMLNILCKYKMKIGKIKGIRINFRKTNSDIYSLYFYRGYNL